MNRKSIYLEYINSKLNGKDIQFPADLKPKNRVEEYLHGISQLISGIDYTLPVDLKPKTKEELFLQWFYDSCSNIDDITSSTGKLMLIDKLVVKLRPLMKVTNLYDYHVFDSNNINFNTLVNTDTVTIKKRGLLKIKELIEELLFKNIEFTELHNCDNLPIINVQTPISTNISDIYRYELCEFKTINNLDNVTVILA